LSLSLPTAPGPCRPNESHATSTDSRNEDDRPATAPLVLKEPARQSGRFDLPAAVTARGSLWTANHRDQMTSAHRDGH